MIPVQDIVGYFAGIGTTISFLPQVLRIIKTGSVNDLSIYTFLIHSTGASLWIVYGIMITNPILIVFNGITAFLNLIILFYFIKSASPLLPIRV